MNKLFFNDTLAGTLLNVICIGTSSISLIHLFIPSNDHLFVMSYTKRMPWKKDVICTQGTC